MNFAKVTPQRFADTLKHIAQSFQLPPRETFGEPMTCEGYRQRIRIDTFEIDQYLLHLFWDQKTGSYMVMRRRGKDTIWQTFESPLLKAYRTFEAQPI